MKRWLLAGIAVVAVLGLTFGGVVVLLTPDHRTTFLVDASESPDFGEVADAVGAAASNMSADDSLALRRFGGTCDSPDTAELVTPGTGQAGKIGDSARAITPGGKATLLSGILAAIDDFARTYPFRGSATNRVVVIARGGADACGKNADEVRTIIKQHTDKAGVKIDFRFVGHRLTSEHVKVLGEIAAATGAQEPHLTMTSGELVTTMKEISVPADLVAQELKTPKACETVTLEVLQALHQVKDNEQRPARLTEFDCQQDRYVLAQADIAPSLGGISFPVLFEFKDQAWHFVEAHYEMLCGDVPPEVWKEWGAGCVPNSVVCREGEAKVTDVSARTGCAAAIEVADRYQAAIDAGQTNGENLSWISGEWACSRQALGPPLQCTSTNNGAEIGIGTT
ncbi:hypothetical protein SK854_22180 [Lentzea sp. BCCO 10_0061]|uniref:VWFA domain-containing protein n=1 Tax=Lentzea sokolovensis TaxID=3095429 RepID=A0ABU4UZ97_9PSEU|nr:hypothetical protein [Lentzea sp. BCCO 10_0061]MDX8144837.1 hypothetical protein [Lentzea sp. BCCO 10_0061]